jgi:hypothetical protein
MPVSLRSELLPVSHSETDVQKRERLWQTGAVTSGRIIIGWRVGT